MTRPAMFAPRPMAVLLGLTICSIAVFACSGTAMTGAEVCTNGVDDNNNGLVDCQDSACSTAPSCKHAGDGGADGPVTTGPLPSVLQSIMTTVTLPKSSTDHALDVDGDEKTDNQLGAIFGALATAAKGVFTGLQAGVDEQLSTGQLILLLDLMATSTSNAPAARGQLHYGVDLDKNPKNNAASGQAYGIASNSPSNLVLNGRISGGRLVVRGDVAVPLPFGRTPLIVTLKKGQLTADVGASGLTNGRLTGAVPLTEVTQRLMPMIAQIMDFYYKDRRTAASIKALMKTWFDTNGDGSVTVAELKANPLISLLIKADVDTDGDGTDDALSLGVGFTTVACTIRK